MTEKSEKPKAVPTCRNCGNFLGMDSSSSSNLAYCQPYGGKASNPCMPWENASKKICYVPK